MPGDKHADVMVAGGLLERIKASRVNLILMALGFAPLLGLFCVMSWGRPAYQFFPLAFAGAAALAWRALRAPFPQTTGPLDYETTRPQDHETAKLPNSQTPKLPNSEISSPSPSLVAPKSHGDGPVVLSRRSQTEADLSSSFPLSRFSAFRFWLRSSIFYPRPSPGPVVRSLLCSALLAFLLANYLWSPWLGYVAFLLGLVAILWSLGGKALVKSFVPAILILLTILPPPLNGDVTLTLWLRNVAVHTSSALLDWLQVTHAQDGNTLLLPNKTLLVEEACSGINSFILCNSLCLFWGLWQRRSPLWFVFALSATSLFVVLGNIIRITAGASAYYFRHWDLLSGRPHEIFGLILLIGYCVLILSFDQWLLFLTTSTRTPSASPNVGVPVGVPAGVPVGVQASACPGKERIGDKLKLELQLGHGLFQFSGAVLALIGLGFFAAHLFLGGHHGLAKLPDLTSVRELNLSLPANVAGWERINANSGDPSWAETWGFRSSNWKFQHNGLTATVAADYPLDGFHNVKGCYLANGWQVLAENELRLPPANQDSHAIELELQKSLQYATVLHSVINGDGQWLSAPLSVTSRLQEDLGPPQKGYRVQMITVGYGPISPAVEADCESLFLQARQSLVQQIVEQLRKSAAR